MIEIESAGPEPTDWVLFCLGWLRNVLIALTLPTAIISPLALLGLTVLIVNLSICIHIEIHDG